MGHCQCGDYCYWLDDRYKEAHILEYCGTELHLRIPATLDGYPVTGISANAFYDSPVETVFFPEDADIDFIEEYAFADCTALTSVVISQKNGISIEDYAFSDCSALKHISFPEPDQEFGNYAFENCVCLEEVPHLQVLTLGYGTFYGCKALKSVSFSDDLESVPDNAFQDCTSLTQITLPEGVTSIGSEAFAGCTGLKRCNIPESVEEIGYDAFRDCPELVLTVCPGHWSVGYAKKNNIPFLLDPKAGGYNGPLYDALLEVFQEEAGRDPRPPLAAEVREEHFGSWMYKNGSWIGYPGDLKRLACFRISANTDFFLQNGLSEALVGCASHPKLTSPFSLSFREPCLRKCSISSLERKYPQLTSKLGQDAQIVAVCEAEPTYRYDLYFALSGETLYILEDYWYD